MISNKLLSATIKPLHWRISQTATFEGAGLGQETFGALCKCSPLLLNTRSAFQGRLGTVVFVWLWEVLGNACLCASPSHNPEGLLGLCVLHEHWCRGHWLAHVVQVVGSFCLAKFIYSFNKYLHCISYMPTTVLGIWEAPGSKTDRAPALVRLHGHVFSSAVEYRVCRGPRCGRRDCCVWGTGEGFT